MPRRSSCLRILLVISACLSLSSPVMAQIAGDLPATTYYAARNLLRRGEVLEATEELQKLLTTAKQTGGDRWIDTIPALVTLGECYYHQGDLVQSLELYDAALIQLLKYPNWIDQVTLEATVALTPEPAIKGSQWFKPSRPSASLATPPLASVQVEVVPPGPDAQGNAGAILQINGRLDVAEVLRCTAVALARRWQILGPLCKHSPLTNPVLQYFVAVPRQPNSWVKSAWQALKSLSMLSIDTKLSIEQISQATYVDQQYDYFLSPCLLLVQGSYVAMQGEYQSALLHFQDATLLANQHGQYDLMSESLLWLGDCASANERVDLIEPLQAAINWCNKKVPFGQIAALSACTELSIQAHNTALSRRLATQQATLISASDQALPRYLARMAYNEALISINEGAATAAHTRVQEALALIWGTAEKGSLSVTVFQKVLTLKLLSIGQLTQADGEAILADLLDQPTRAEWELHPLETLGALTISSVPAFQRLLKLTNFDDLPTKIQRAEMVLQRQLYEMLPLAGKPLAWKSLITTPTAQLPADLRAVLQSAVQRNPELNQLSVQLTQAVSDLRLLPFPKDERQLKVEQKKSYLKMEELADNLDLLVLRQAISRQYLRPFLPGEFQLTAVQQQLSEDDLLLGLIDLNDQVLGIAIGKTEGRVWHIEERDELLSRTALLYQQIQLFRNGSTPNSDDPTEASALWRSTANELFDQLFPHAELEAWIGSSKRLIVVPHGPLWYLPFELLIGPQLQPIIAHSAVTYVPTLGSVGFAFSGGPAQGQSLVFANNYFALDREKNQRLLSEVGDSIANSVLVDLEQRHWLPSSTWLRACTDELTIFSPVQIRSSQSQQRLMPIDANPRNRLSDWSNSVLPSPKMLVLGAMESSLQTGKFGDGADFLQPVCGMLFSGTHGVISRWAVGGESSARFWQRARPEIAQSGTVSDALRRSSLALWAETFPTATEPVLLKRKRDAAPLTSGEHPLFWAGYMAIGDQIK